MEHLKISFPEQRNYEQSYGLACKLAWEQLAQIKDLEEQCRKSDSRYEKDNSREIISLEYLKRTYRIILPENIITSVDSIIPVELRDKILILHYLLHAKGTPLSGKPIAYKELPEGAVYFPTFHKRAIKPLIDYFGSTPEKLTEVAGSFGGIKTTAGDSAVTIPAFQRVPITLVLWKGDDEFPPEGNILFDSTVPDYLSVEDLNVLCQTIVWELVKSLKAGGEHPGKG